jgi:hypothetical protein
MRRRRSLQRLVGYTAGSFAAALEPAAFFFLRPMRVVGRGGGSYLGLSFYQTVSASSREMYREMVTNLLVLVVLAILAATHARLALTLLMSVSILSSDLR